MTQASMTLERACGEFLLDLRVRKLAASTIRDYESIFRQLRRFADERGKTDLAQVDQELLRDWRATWTCVASTHQLRVTKLKAFFRFAVDASWVSKSPADRLRAPQERSQPTMPLSRFEMRLMLEAARSYAKERALLMLMRYSGLAIRDATTLERGAITGNLLTLRRAKSNELVLCSLPDPVIAELNAIADPGKEYFFWSGRSSPETVSRYWRARLARIAVLAGVKDFKTHRLRDTFAVELLLAGVSIEDLSSLLGHRSIRVTERHYAPWDSARRNRIVSILHRVNARDELLKELSVSSQRVEAEAQEPDGRGTGNGRGAAIGSDTRCP